MTIDVPSAAGYGENATVLAAQYESIAFADVHRDMLHLFPPASASVVDIGAGSGRDAAALALRGHQVVAVEPTGELRREGQRIHGTLEIEWVDDHLPMMRVLRQAKRKFDLVLLTAVWMHLDATEQAVAMEAVSDLANDYGQVFMSLRHGPIPQGRRMFDVSAEETIGMAQQFGFECRHHIRREDMLGRDDVKWSFLALRRVPREP